MREYKVTSFQEIQSKDQKTLGWELEQEDDVEARTQMTKMRVTRSKLTAESTA